MREATASRVARTARPTSPRPCRRWRSERSNGLQVLGCPWVDVANAGIARQEGCRKVGEPDGSAHAYVRGNLKADCSSPDTCRSGRGKPHVRGVDVGAGEEQACALPGGECGHHGPSTGVERDPMMGLHVTHDATALRPGPRLRGPSRTTRRSSPVRSSARGALGIAHQVLETRFGRSLSPWRDRVDLPHEPGRVWRQLEVPAALPDEVPSRGASLECQLAFRGAYDGANAMGAADSPAPLCLTAPQSDRPPCGEPRLRKTSVVSDTFENRYVCVGPRRPRRSEQPRRQRVPWSVRGYGLP